ncbi:hypothetical protein PSAL_007390 [Pseudooceanicola algae]|uniref:Uncharacterized protein n=1 Tax=Pseudooceanicola algae TaxID=1537215 RepID=A0A418SDZ4_9RHOB|nr:hypothetical protein PSAL_007390 [Pseudooceanicola algae]
MSEVLKVMRRSRATLLQDLLGVVALTVLLVGSLYLPVII